MREYIEEERSESIVSDIMKNFADELASIYGEDAEITKMARGEIEDNKWKVFPYLICPHLVSTKVNCTIILLLSLPLECP